MPVDPVAGGGLPPGFAEIIAHELEALAADAQTLKSRLLTGDIVHAVVLSSNGLTDLLDIGGLRVAAELPSTLLPGETIAVEVTGFTGDRINLHILPNTPPPAASSAALPRAAAEAAPRSVSGRPVSTGERSSHAGLVRGAGVLNERAVERPASVAPPRSPASVEPAGLRNIEARLATAQATTARAEPPGGVGTGSGRTPVTNTGTAGTVPVSPVVPRPFIAPRPPAAAASAIVPAVRGLAAYTEPAALLRALHLPVTPNTVAAARLALESPQRLTRALESLERALRASTDPHVATLRTLVAFLARIEPRSPVLATQIAAFVDHVVVGREGKLARLLEAHSQGPAALKATGNTPVNSERGSSRQPLWLGAERVAIRQAALDYDLKTQMFAVGKDGREGAGTPKTPELATAVGHALTAVTALQLGAAATLAADPDGLSFAVPIALPSGFAQAQVRIGRDASPGAKVVLDGDNFHIAFVLETQHLGTVAIDLATVGRSVTLSVQTEAVPAQQAFGAALNRLTHRLEALRYGVVKADASVAPRGPATPQAASSAPAPDRSLTVDLDA